MPSEQGINRKRKNNNHFHILTTLSELEEEENEFLTLSLSSPPARRRCPEPLPVATAPSLPPRSNSLQSLLSPPPPQFPLQLSSSHPIYMPSRPAPAQQNVVPSRGSRSRRKTNQSLREGKSNTVPAPFPWATTHRATVHSMSYLLLKQIFKISGSVQCKQCQHLFEIEYDLVEKFNQVGSFIEKNKDTMRDRAPNVWKNPVLPTCKFCEQENSAKPIIADKKKSINWLFLFLGQMLGCCTLEQLKYFCKHTKKHRTGAKDRVLYLTYLELCNQLNPKPNRAFDR